MEKRTTITNGLGTFSASIEYGGSSCDYDFDDDDDDDYSYNPNGNPTTLSFVSMSQIEKLKLIPHKDVVCIDIETTGLNPSTDEILQVSICNGYGNALLNSYVRPEKRRRWPNAEKVNGITWDMVKDSPSIVDLSFEIEDILNSAKLIIGFNIKRFDFEFLKYGRVDISGKPIVYDLIYDCSVMYGKWSNHYANYSFVSLERMARQYGIEYHAHDSASDVIATTEVFYRFLEDEKLLSKVANMEKISREVAEKAAQRKAEAEERKRKEKEEIDRRLAEEEEKRRRAVKTHNQGMTIVTAVAIVILISLLCSCMAMCFSGSSSRYRSTTRYVISNPIHDMS